jgi:hypothetical protein
LSVERITALRPDSKALDSQSGHQKSLQLLRQLIRAEDQVVEAQPARWLRSGESPVEGAWFEEEKSSCSKRAILALLSCSSFKRFSLSSSPFSLSSDLILSCSISCSMSYTGRQLSIASKRRQGGKVQTHSDLVSGRETPEVEEVVIAVVRGERNQEQQGACQKG